MTLSAVKGTRATGTTGTINLSSMTVAVNDVLVVCSACDANFTPGDNTITKVSGTATIDTPVYEIRQESGGQAAISWVRVTGAGTLVLGVASRSVRTDVIAWNVTGAHTTDCIGAKTGGGSATNEINPGLTTQIGPAVTGNLNAAGSGTADWDYCILEILAADASDSFVFFSGNEWNALGSPTSSDLVDFDTFTNANQSGGAGYVIAEAPGGATVEATGLGAWGALTGTAVATVQHEATAAGAFGALTGTAQATVQHEATALGTWGALTGTMAATVEPPGEPQPFTGPIKHRETGEFLDNDVYVRVGGVWQRVDVMYRRESGVWVRYM